MKKQNLPTIPSLQKNVLKKICTILLFLGVHFMLYGQDWRNPLGEPNPNFYDIQKNFNDYWQGKDFKTTKGWKAYRRWEDFWLPRINPDGSFPAPNISATEWSNYRSTHPALVTRSPLKPDGLLTTTGAWTTMGPTTSNSGYSGIGRINCVAFHPTDPNIFWVGTPAGGLWQTTDGGVTWGTNSEDFPSLGVSAIAVNPVDPDVIYIGTGDGDGYDTYFYGMRRSTDGGASWATMAVPLPNYSVARRIIINPNTPSTIIASTSNGIYRSTDDGANWTLTSSAMNMYDIAFKPGDPNTVYASSSSQVFVSVNGGASWTSTLTVANSRRIALAVTAADPNVVGVLSASSINSGFNGYYSSVNSGTSFTLKTSTPNLLGWETNGSDTGGQGSYDLCVAISPTDANTVYVGGVNLWKSTNGGTSWSINTHWSSSGAGFTTVHADKHYLAYQNSGTLFQTCDGGVYKTTNDGTSWTDLSNGLVISQMYRLGTAQTSAAVMTGLQDNSSKLMTPSVQWLDILSTGDGMEGAIDPTNDKIAYTESYYGSISRLGLGANYQRTSAVDITPINSTTNLKESGAWVTPFVLDPNNPATMYIGYNDIYKSPDRGATWTKLSTNLSPSPNKILQIAVAPSNSNYIYASNQASTLFKTTNGGSTWSSLSPPATNITSIAVNPTNPDIIFVTCSNYSSGQKVFKSVNGGTTWTNLSGTLPNVPANCIIYEKNTNEGLYIGTDLGVFYKNAALPDWIPFQDGLPNVIVRELEINYSTFKVLAATYGRGLWQSTLYYDGPAVCNAPSGLSATNVTALSATLSWTGSQLATTYTLQYRPVMTPTAAWTDIIVNSNSTIITGLAPATQYEYQVRSNCDADVSAYSVITTFTTATGDCFKTPTAQGASSNTYTGISTMYWTSQTGISKYKIEWKKASDANWQVGYQTNINSAYFDINGLTPTTTYQWRVSSVCVNEIISAPSSILMFTTPAPSCSGVASAPTLYQNGVWANAAYLYWSQTYGKGYLFAYKKTSETDWTYRTFASDSYIRLDNLLPGTTYECKVKSVCDGLNEVYSNVQTFTTKAENCADRFVPLAEYTVTNITNTTATLNWPAVPNATGYRLEMNSTILTVSGTSYNMTGLTANTAYYFRVTPLCATGSPYLYPYTFGFRTSGTGCQAPPTLSPLASSTATTAKVYWGPTGGATGYTVQYRLSDPTNYYNSTNPWTSFSTANTNYTFTGLAPHTSYDYKITTSTDGCYYIYNSVTTADAPTGLRPFPVGLPTCLEDDFRELEKLYNATGGDSWTNKTNWFTSPDLATWYGITLTTTGCDVQSIIINANNLVGTLPLLSFPELLYFRGWYNALSGTIPNFNLPKLIDFNFQNQNTKGGGFTGSIPNFSMPNLKTLHLWGNKLSGSIPNFNMPLLEQLWLSGNQLSGTIPNFNMPNMLNIDLGGNSLSGTVPNFNMPNLLRLAFGFNPLSGTIPNFNMPSLQELWGQNCQFTGDIPNFNMPYLQKLILNNNLLSGNIPNFNLPNLIDLQVQSNQLNGTISNFNAPLLENFVADVNQLTGSIPNFNMPNLKRLVLSDNLLSGSIPNFNMPNLEYLRLYNNQLSGTIPNFNMPKLVKLYLNVNKLTGSIPNFNLPLVDTLFLRNNELTGSIPNFNLPNLVSLSIRNNQLSGSVPDFNLPKLQQLRLDTNQLSGVVPNFSNCNLLSGGTAILRLDANKFVFGDLEGKPWLNISDIKYTPQAKIPITLSLTAGLLTVNTGSLNSNQQFEWYKNDVLVTTNQNNFFSPSGAGKYYCKVRHNVLTVPSDINKNLVLQSEDYNIGTVIPVELLNLTATPLSKTTQLNWQTASEKNASHFDVEQSSNGKTFDKIGEVKANGNSATVKSYSFIDETPFNGLNYYRLRQVDEDGTANLSNTVSVIFNSNQKLKVFPNPTKDKLSIISESIENYSIIDVLGREILRGVISGNQTDVDVSNLSSGMYLVKTKTESVKFSKN